MSKGFVVDGFMTAWPPDLFGARERLKSASDNEHSLNLAILHQ